MNQNESVYFNEKELNYPDATSLPASFLLKSLFVKLRRKILGRVLDRRARFQWTVDAVSDAHGPAANVRNYRERRTLRALLAGIKMGFPITAACEVGSGYGRLTMLLSEFAEKTVGFEREPFLVGVAQKLVPEVRFHNVPALDCITSADPGPFDFAMTYTVLQHLTDDHCRAVIEEIKRAAPKGHILLVEKTEDISTTAKADDGDEFLSRARDVDRYSRWMAPYRLVSTAERVMERTYFNPKPGTCMLFRSPLLDGRGG